MLKTRAMETDEYFADKGNMHWQLQQCLLGGAMRLSLASGPEKTAEKQYANVFPQFL